MKRPCLAACLLLAAAPLAAPLAAQPLPASAVRDVLVMAHRGCWEGGAPEVSVAAVRACEAIGPDLVELDVQRTRDGELVLMHDETVDRMTDGRGRIADMTTAEIRALRLRERDGGPAARLTDEHVPTLEEGLRAAKGRFVVNLHLKLPVEREVAEVVKRLGMAGQVTSWVSGRADDARLAASPLRGVVRMIPIIGACGGTPDAPCRPNAPADYAFLRPAGFYVIPEESVSGAPALAFIGDAAAAERPEGAWIMASTLFEADMLPRAERRAVWRRLIDRGVGLIMTDRPADLIDLLDERPQAGR